MIVLSGEPISPGAALGVGIRIGICGQDFLPQELLQQASHAIRNNLPEQDYPQIVVLCDNIEREGMLHIPGLKVIAIAARDHVENAPELQVPAVVGLGDELECPDDEGGEEIVIVDGTHGKVYVAPDAMTVQRYERLLDRRHEERRYFLDQEHLPARTMDGRLVTVVAAINPGESISEAVAAGADELLFHSAEEIDLERVLAECGGKRIILVTASPRRDILHAALWQAAPRQVAIALPVEAYTQLRVSLERDIDSVRKDMPDDVLEPSEISIGAITHEMSKAPKDADFLIIKPDEKALQATTEDWMKNGKGVPVTLVVGDDLDAFRKPVEVGINGVAVSSGLVEQAKNLIRTLPPDYIVE